MYMYVYVCICMYITTLVSSPPTTPSLSALHNLKHSHFFFSSLLLSSLELGETKVYAPPIRALLGTA